MEDGNQAEESGTQSGQLPGMAQNQDSVITQDVVARESRAEVMREQQGNGQDSRPTASASASHAGNFPDILFEAGNSRVWTYIQGEETAYCVRLCETAQRGGSCLRRMRIESTTRNSARWDIRSRKQRKGSQAVTYRNCEKPER